MNPPQLRDIHLPDASFWWPPAPGWWLLLALLLLAAWFAPHALRRLRQRSARQLSKRELVQIRRRFESNRSTSVLLGELSALLRRTLITYHGRRGYAASIGDAWIEQIRLLSPQQGFSAGQLALLGHDRYRRVHDVDVEALLVACERWIEALPRRPSDVPT